MKDNTMNFREYLGQQYTSQTASRYARAVDHFTTHGKTKNGKKETHQQIIDYLHKHNKASAPVLAALKQYFDYLIDQGVRKDHPCNRIATKKKSKPMQHQDLFTVEELELLFTKEERYPILENRNKALLSLLIYQGLTPQNIVNLRTVDIDLDSGTVYIMATRQLTRRTLELRSNQVLRLHAYIYEDRVELMKTARLLSPSKYERLFVTKLGENMSVDALNRMLRPMQGLYNDKNLNASTIRQSVILNWINHYKYPMEDVQLLAGHRWLSSTAKYKVANRDDNKEKINRFFPL
ncbi:MAG: tyrosine-type recombinase/integrase [Crocinitomicaceae bacterium]|nr:tyrosine-type recombinase/integrase [Flavobacteriales bacterium]NQZ38331.1 tyrosine-type recombinase/integrase [Crocinitomicaceae bacterium]